jgi:glycosyltransferase involved in cell wall biosynthesis
MMRGTAVIASGWGGVTEIVRDGVSGLLVPPNDPAALAGALARILGDRAMAERMGAEAREFALAELTEDRFLDRFEQIYRGLVGAPAAPEPARAGR